MGKYRKLAEDIVENVGGIENISSVTHCITRLRFHLKDEGKAKDDVLKAMDGVVTVMHSAGQYQVVIGNHVPYVYEDVCEVCGIGNEIKEKEAAGEEAPKGAFNKLIDIVSGCFQPILGPLCASGIIRGLNALLVFLLGTSYNTSGTYLILNAIGDAIFYFLPVILGYTAARKFNVNVVVGMIIGGALCYPSIQADALSAAGEAIGSIPFIGDYYSRFIGIPFVPANYTSSVVPVLIIVALAALIQKYAKKLIPEAFQNFFVPFFVLLISLPIGFLIIGPVISMLTELLSQGFAAVYSFSPIISGLLVGFAWQILVIFGLHWAIVPLAMVNIENLGYDTILVGQFGTTFALTAALLAMCIKMKDKKKRSLAVPMIISGFCGVTEPGIYGYALPEKKPFIFSCIAAAIGGGVFTFLGGHQYVVGGLGIFGIVSFIDQQTGDATSMYYSFVCILVSMVIGFLLTWFFWKDTSAETQEMSGSLGADGSDADTAGTIHIALKDEETIGAPMTGEIIPLEELKDDPFSSGVMGQGAGIEPSEGRVFAPVDGTVSTLFPTLHAVGITSDNGAEILIHVGMDTVQLNGEGFIAHVNQGDRVKRGQLLLDVDLKLLREKGYSTQTPVLVVNPDDMSEIQVTDQKQTAVNDDFITVHFKR